MTGIEIPGGSCPKCGETVGVVRTPGSDVVLVDLAHVVAERGRFILAPHGDRPIVAHKLGPHDRPKAGSVVVAEHSC